MDLKPLMDFIVTFVEEKLISKRFILAIAVLGAGLYKPDVITKDLILIVLSFYFASHATGNGTSTKTDTSGD